MISSIVIDRQAGSKRRIREKHVDSTGKVHTVGYWAANDFDVNANLTKSATKIQTSLEESEVNSFIAAVTNGENPFRDTDDNEVTPTYCTRNEMLTKVLTEILSSDDPTVFMKSAPYLARLNNQSLKALLAIDNTKVSEIRAKTKEVKDYNSYLESYIAPMGSGN